MALSGADRSGRGLLLVWVSKGWRRLAVVLRGGQGKKARVRLLVVVAAILAWSSGCGGDDSTPSEEGSADSSPSTGAVEASLEAESYVMTVTGQIPGGDGAIPQTPTELV